jgi:hypothetical protein
MNSKKRRAARAADSLGHRQARLEHLLFESLDAIIRGDVGDPCVEDVRLTRVTLSPDGRIAIVWYLGGAEPDSSRSRCSKVSLQSLVKHGEHGGHGEWFCSREAREKILRALRGLRGEPS